MKIFYLITKFNVFIQKEILIAGQKKIKYSGIILLKKIDVDNNIMHDF